MMKQTNQPDDLQGNSPEPGGQPKTQPAPGAARQEAAVIDWLESHRPHLEARAGFLTEPRARLITRIQHEAPRSLWQRAWSAPRFRFMAHAVSLLLLGLVLLGFQSVLISAARVALPGEGLHPVKLALEQVRVGFCFDEAQRAGLHVALARERSNELQALLIEADYAPVEMASLRLLDQVEAARLYISQAENISQAHRQALIQDLNQTLSLQALVLRALVNTTPSASQPMVKHVLLLVHD